MIVRLIVFAVLGLSLLFLGMLLYKSYQSHKTPGKVGVTDGQLQACSEKPNCVSSFADPSDEQHHYPPLEGEPIEALWQKLNTVLQDMGYQVVTADNQYIHATETSKIMRYIDDIEFLYSETENKIFVRSASRVGYSDLGANRKRMDAIFKKVYEK